MQSTVRKILATGIVGELFNNGMGTPVRTKSFILNSTSAANNTFGRAVQMVASSEDTVTADLGSAGVFAGLIGFPKQHAAASVAAAVSGDLLANDDAPCEIIQQGSVIVSLAASSTAGTVGTPIEFQHTTGILRASSGVPDSGWVLIPNSQIAEYNVTTAGGLTVVYFDALANAQTSANTVVAADHESRITTLEGA